MSYFLLISGLILLIIGGEILVKGAVNIAFRAKISTLVVGMTIVSLGTSAPELLVSLKASLSGHPDIALGNVVGSNIANIALILGITAIIFPLVVERNSIRYDWPIMMLVTSLFYIFIIDRSFVWYEGLILLILLISYIVFVIWKSRKENIAQQNNSDEEIEPVKGKLYKDILFVLTGCVGLAFGADWLVKGAVDIARDFGIDELVISVTIVAFGTSAPELVTSVVAAIRQQSDISVGNIIGSNLFNIAGIMGITGLVTNLEINKKVVINDMLWVLGLSFVLLPMMISGKKISRIEGVFLFLVYLAYIFSLFLFQKV
jgi:cation:H+ antiporter